MSSSEVKSTQPSWQDIEKALVVVISAGFYYKKQKDGKFLQRYKKRIDELRKADDPAEYIIVYAQRLIPNEAKYKQMKKDYSTWYKYEPRILKALESLNEMYYKIAKEYFQSDEDIEKEVDDFLNDGNTDEVEEFINE